MSQAVQPGPGDTKCMSCTVLFSVLKQKPENNTAMWWCSVCQEYQCSLCLSEKDFPSSHVAKCSQSNDEQEEEIQEDDAEAVDGEGNNDNADLLLGIFG